MKYKLGLVFRSELLLLYYYNDNHTICIINPSIKETFEAEVIIPCFRCGRHAGRVLLHQGD